MVRMWEKYPHFVEAIREDHRKAGALLGGGHEFVHVLVVGEWALKIGDEWAELAWIAALCHNTDRLFSEDKDNEIQARIQGYLALLDPLLPADKADLVVKAVLTHDQPPSPKDNPVTIVLMDADKLGVLGAHWPIRAGQFRPMAPPIDLRYTKPGKIIIGKYGLPQVDPAYRPPDTNYQNPGSIFWDMQGVLEWEEPGWIRTSKARDFARPFFQQLRQLSQEMVAYYQCLDLIPYPFAEDFKTS